MPLFGKVYACPNTSCEFDQPLKEGQKCPHCGAEVKAFGLREAMALSASKKKAPKISGSSGSGGKSGYYCPNPHCTCVTELKQGEKCPVCGTEAQSDDAQDTLPGRPTSGRGSILFTESTTDEDLMKKIRSSLERLDSMDKGSAVYEQSRIIILQNELILRKLNRQ